MQYGMDRGRLRPRKTLAPRVEYAGDARQRRRGAERDEPGRLPRTLSKVQRRLRTDPETEYRS